MWSIDEYGSYTDIWDEPSNLLNRLDHIPCDISKFLPQALFESYYFQQRSAAMAVNHKRGHLSDKCKAFIKASRDVALTQAQMLTTLSIDHNVIFLPMWWGVFNQALLNHPSESVRKAYSLAAFDFSHDLSVLACLRDNGVLSVSLITRVLLQNLLTPVVSSFIEYCNERQFDVKLLDDDAITQMMQFIEMHTRFLNQSLSAAMIPVAHPATRNCGEMAFRFAEYATKFIVYHELAHLSLHSKKSFESIEFSSLRHEITYIFPSKEEIELEIRRLADEAGFSIPMLDGIAETARLLENKTVKEYARVPEFSAFEKDRLSSCDLEELEADCWAFDALCEEKFSNDNFDVIKFCGIVFGVYFVVLLLSLQCRTNYYNNALRYVGKSEDSANDRQLRWRLARLRRHILDKLKGLYIYPEHIRYLDFVHETYCRWMELSCGDTSLSTQPATLWTVNMATISVRFESASREQMDELLRILTDLKAEAASEDLKHVQIIHTGRQRGFGFTEAYEVFLGFTATPVGQITISLIASLIYDAAKETCRRIFLAGRESSIDKVEIERRLLAEMPASASGTAQDAGPSLAPGTTSPVSDSGSGSSGAAQDAEASSVPSTTNVRPRGNGVRISSPPPDRRRPPTSAHNRSPAPAYALSGPLLQSAPHRPLPSPRSTSPPKIRHRPLNVTLDSPAASWHVARLFILSPRARHAAPTRSHPPAARTLEPEARPLAPRFRTNDSAHAHTNPAQPPPIAFPHKRFRSSPARTRPQGAIEPPSRPS